MSERPSMFELNVPCDDCRKNIAGIYICTGCYEKKHEDLRAKLAAETAKRLESEKARWSALNRRMATASEARSAERAEAEEWFNQALAQRDEAMSQLASARQRLERVEGALRACADSLEEEVRGHHGVGADTKLEEMHPVSVRRFERDMASVREARAALNSTTKPMVSGGDGTVNAAQETADAPRKDSPEGKG